MSAVIYGSIIITIFIAVQKKPAHRSTGISMILAECIDYVHAGCIITAAEHVYKCVCGIVVADSDHWIKIIIQGICAVGLAELLIVFVDCTHNKEFDQTGSLHWLVIDRTFGVFHKIADVDRPVSIILWKQCFDLRKQIIQTFISGGFDRSIFG